MSESEFSYEFDVSYNGIANNTAPPLDLYEKSVYLTKAQLQIVNNYFNPAGNKYRDGFENSEKRRRDLNELVYPWKTTLKISSDHGVSENSQFFKLPLNVFMIIQERAKVASDDCNNNKYLKVVPRTHDEFNLQENNPFRSTKEVIPRLDSFSQGGASKNVELISEYNIIEYKCRYVKYPEPIILTDLLTAFPTDTLSIDGVSASQTCKLSESVHREILDRAVELALADYKPENLQIKAQVNQRNE
jgi:hypothetical protein